MKGANEVSRQRSIVRGWHPITASQQWEPLGFACVVKRGGVRSG